MDEEQCVAMLSSVLNSARGIQINIQIIDTFVKIRQWALDNKEMSKRIDELEHYFMQHCKDNEVFIKTFMHDIFQALSANFEYSF